MSETTSIYICQICKREFESNLGRRAHLWRTHKITSKDYYDQFIKTENEGICTECGKETNYINSNLGYRKYCSNSCSTSSEETQNKMKSTMTERHGHEHALQVPEIHEKMECTNFKRYGHKYYFQVPEFQYKMGVTMIKRYGAPNAMQVQEFKEKSIDTCIGKYGVPYASQVPEIHNKKLKSGYKIKPYKFPSGIEIFLQGNERQAIDSLLPYFPEEEIIAGDSTKIPRIPYLLDGDIHYYLPDIWIPSINTLVEVKSTYTIKCDIEKNIAKHKYSEYAGYDHVFMVV